MNSTVQTAFEEFRSMVLDDERLQAELRCLSERTDFIARVVTLARERGFGFTVSDIEEEMRIGRRSWTADSL